MDEYPFPVATLSYFRVCYQARARAVFLASATSQPAFQYLARFSEVRVLERLRHVAPQSWAHESLDLVLTAARLQSDPVAHLAEFRAKNAALFGEPSKALAMMILARVEERVTAETAELWDFIVHATGYEAGEAVQHVHDEATFTKYKRFLERYINRLSSIDDSAPLPAVLERVLMMAGLQQRGWRVVVVSGAAHARVRHHTRTITVGRNYQLRHRRGARRIAIHEVYGHALRGHQDSIAEGEGFALFLEQLLDVRPRFRRSYRYLATALGWGVMGEPLAFREVYEIIWRCMVIMSGYTPERAQHYAFDECARVFRGGRPDVPGAVYLKDSIYFVANRQIWQRLAAEDLQYTDFVDIIEGRRKVLG